MNGSYEKACEVVGDIFPLNLPIRSLERIVGDVREDVVRYYDQKPTPESSEQAVITVATIDRKGVVIRKPPSEEAAAKAAPSDPDKPGKKKMSTVTSAYNIKRHRRTAYQVGREINEEEPLPDKPKPEAKEVWGSVIETVEQGIFRLKQAVDKRLKATREDWSAFWMASEACGAWSTSIFPRLSSCSTFSMSWNILPRRLTAFMRKRLLRHGNL